MNCLFVIDNLGSGGSERQIVYLAKHYRSLGHSVSILTYTKDDFYKEEVEKNGIDIICIGRSSLWKMILGTIKVMKRLKPDIVVAFLAPQIILCQIASLFYKPKKLVISRRSANEAFFMSRRMKVISKMLRKVDYIVCNSVYETKLWGKYYLEAESKIRVINNVVDIPQEVTGNISENRDQIRIIVAATYYSVKNVDGLVEALNILPEEIRSRLKVDWYGRSEVKPGDTAAYDLAIHKREEYHLENCLSLYERTADIFQKMADADVVGLFSVFEGMPNAICEGMMLGKAIIMTKVSDYEKLAGEGNGIICKSHSPEDIAVALTELCSLPYTEIKRMGEKSKEIAQRSFSPKAVFDSWDQVLL